MARGIGVIGVAAKQQRLAKTIIPKSTTGGSNVQDVVGRNL